MSLALSELLNPAPSSGPVSPKKHEALLEPYDGSRDAGLSDQTPSNLPPSAQHHPPSTVDSEDLQGPSSAPTSSFPAAPVLPLIDQKTPEHPQHHFPEHALANMRELSVEDRAMVAEGNTIIGPADSHEHSGEIKAESDATMLNTLPPVSAPRKQNSSLRPKTEGLDSDKRYLCHVCNKLFTRRRSVKDHINKIHPGQKFEPEKSLEIIVDPATGQPIDPTSIPELPASTSPAPSQASATLPPPTSVPPAVPPLKTEPSGAGSRASSIDPLATPAPVIGKKRPAPSESNSQPKTITKKGTASKVKNHTTPLSKKIKTSNESESIISQPFFRSPSSTPASSRVKKSPALKTKKQSEASVASSPAPSESRISADAQSEPDEGDTPNTNDDGEVFCICRKGDNHTWMIACDGQCEDWYHGKCVGIAERDGDLIDKYICPSCTREGFQTTWKRMCRRKACRKPARVTNDPPSKYCSPICGRLFFVEMVQRSDPDAVASPTGQHIVDPSDQKKYRKKKRKLARRLYENGNGMDVEQKEEDSPYPSPPGASFIPQIGHLKHAYSIQEGVTSDEDTENVEFETDTSSDEEPLPSRGGALRAGEIKSLAMKYNSVEKWREDMGKRPTDAPFDNEGNSLLRFNEFENRQINSIAKRIANLKSQVSELVARERYLGLVKKRSAIIIEKVRKENPKQKEICGFDPRLSWPDEMFSVWKDSPEGIAAFATETLGAPAESVKTEVKGNDHNDSDDDSEEAGADVSGVTREGVCIKNRCQRHRNWQKVQMAELRFEMDRITKSIDLLQREEANIKDRAILRAWEDTEE